MKKPLCVLLAAMLALALLPAAALAEDVTLTMQVSAGWTDEADEALAEMFYQETGIRIEFQVVPAGQHHDLLKTKLNTGEAPDIFWIQASPLNLYGELDPAKNCLPMTGAQWESNMPDARVEAVSYDGVLYGQAIWNQSVSFPFSYNKTLFDEMGLEVPTTFEALKDVCQALLDADIIPIFECVSDGWHHGLICTQIGGRIEQLMPDVIEKLNTNQVKLKETPFLDALNQSKELVDLGYFGEDYISNTSNDAAEVVAYREYAMYIGMSISETIKTDYPECEDEFGLFLIPLLDNQTSQADPYGPAKFASATTQYPDEVKAYFDFCMRTENLQYKLDNNTSGWTSLDVTEETGVEQHFSENEIELMSSISSEDYGVIFQNRVKYFNEGWMEYCKDLVSLWMGELDAEGVCDAIDERRTNLAIAQGDENWQ